MASGPFNPNWVSLSSYQTPEWFKNAKFGVWARWGPQCQPEFGDWYVREMYMEGSRQNKYHVEKYGRPSKFGFKNVINVPCRQLFVLNTGHSPKPAYAGILKCLYAAFCLTLSVLAISANAQTINLNGNAGGKRFDGVGAVSGGEAT